VFISPEDYTKQHKKELQEKRQQQQKELWQMLNEMVD